MSSRVRRVITPTDINAGNLTIACPSKGQIIIETLAISTIGTSGKIYVAHNIADDGSGTLFILDAASNKWAFIGGIYLPADSPLRFYKSSLNGATWISGSYSILQT